MRRVTKRSDRSTGKSAASSIMRKENMTFARKTLARPVSLFGHGLHTGARVGVCVYPGGTGIWFRCGPERVRASVENVSGTERCTRLGGISTVEHVLSALAGLEITEAEIELTAPELPALDGSAKEYMDAVLDSGLETVGTAILEGPLESVDVQDESVRVVVSPGSGRWQYTFLAPERWPYEMVADVEDVVSEYAEQIAPARTWVFEDEIPALKARGLGRGLNEESLVQIGKDGYLSPPRFANEPARHKLLDVIGDLYLSGVPIRMLDVSAKCSGHRAHVEAARRLSESVRLAPV